MIAKGPANSTADDSLSLRGCYNVNEEEASLTQKAINRSPEMWSVDAFPLESFKQ